MVRIQERAGVEKWKYQTWTNISKDFCCKGKVKNIAEGKSEVKRDFKLEKIKVLLIGKKVKRKKGTSLHVVAQFSFRRALVLFDTAKII